MKNKIQSSSRKKGRISPENERALIEHNNTIKRQHSTSYLSQVMINLDMMLELMSWLSDNEEPDSLFRTITDQSNKGKIILKGSFLHLILTFRWLYDLIYIEQHIKVQIQSRGSDFTATISQVPWLRSTALKNFNELILINNAVSRGSLDVIKWAHEQNPLHPWHEVISTNAAKGGHLDILQWLRAQAPPCPWDEEECYNIAEANNHSHIMEWMRPIASSTASNAITQNGSQGFFNAASTEQHPGPNHPDSTITLR